MIRITDKHIFLDERDIAPFVDRKSVKIEGGRVSLVLLGDIVDERETQEAPQKTYKKAVKDDD